MSPLELVDDRFEKLAAELRASRPVVPTALSERVASLAAVEPAGPRWTFRLPSRRVVLAIAATALLASFVVAGVTGLRGSGTTSHENHGAAAGTRLAPSTAPAPVEKKAPVSGAELAPTVTRLQRYEATLRVRVNDVEALSNASRRAMSLTRSLGGYVASVSYATQGGKRGGATLVLRVPVTNIQRALAGLTSLGTILQQHTALLDVTKRADREASQIAKVERQLATASPAERPVIEARLRALRVKHARLVRSARLARIELSLTTPAQQAAASPSRFHRTLDDAGSVLVRELEILLYALVVVGPLLLVGGAAIAAARAQRRRSDRRLLERA
jgi:hypothetical protein